MNRSILYVFAAILFSIVGQVESVHAQKIAVVDMQAALKNYYRTDQEIAIINKLGNDKLANIDQRKADYQTMTKEMVMLDGIVRSNSETEERRRSAQKELIKVAELRDEKASEIADSERKAQRELLALRKKMEGDLLQEINRTVAEIVQALGFDMVLDRSFLPNASKVVLYTSPRVTDVTNEVISRLNSRQPARN